ncbi:hypothetical protein K2173_018283 [Erythroxylum novogranatense]|uniref:Uncharacterized protein n=1 Tax=Erythroxylum novogranatense TaxID=1862640 RepID=A0AAV8UA45_9ROSI|nr:hypothetical protein K2173_018283 [Erythroxylum novogranatense]
MNTKTMRLPPRRVVTSNKRKEREGFDPLKPFTQQQEQQPAKSSKLTASSEPEPVLSNQLLAGYLAHEYLTRGTLYGQPLEQTSAQADPTKKIKPRQNVEAELSHQRYVEVSSLLKTDGAHLAGIVNPTQLACILQMGR